MGPIRGGGGGGPPGGVRVFWGTGPLVRNLNISAESSAQTKSIGTLFEQIGFRGGSGGNVRKVRGTRARV